MHSSTTPAVRQVVSALDALARVDRFASEGPRFLPRDGTAEQIRGLERVIDEESTRRRSPHDGSLIRYVRLKFDHGLEVTFREVEGSPRVQVTQVVVSGQRWAIADRLGVGAPVARVLGVLGQPVNRTKSTLSYQGETERVRFRVRDARVVSVTFEYYAD
jgi:hypothetical protein